jgi:hypothetical protein
MTASRTGRNFLKVMLTEFNLLIYGMRIVRCDKCRGGSEVEQMIRNHQVVGSIPTLGSIIPIS